MTHSFLFLVAAAAIAGATNGEAHSSFVPRANKGALLIRGGAGPLDVTDTAKVATIINGLNAGMVVLSPKKAEEVYGITFTPKSLLIFKRIGATVLQLSLMAYCLVFKGTSSNTAIGIGQIPWVVTILGDLLNSESKDQGLPQAPQVFTGAITTFIAHACLTDTSYVDTAVKVGIVWTFFCGLTSGLAPVTACKQWGLGNVDATTTLMAKQLGFFFVGVGVMMYALSQGVDSLRAIGYSWIPMLLNVLDMVFVSKDVEELDLPTGPLYFWIAMMAVFVGTLAID